jgi:hypothetical protein
MPARAAPARRCRNVRRPGSNIQQRDGGEPGGSRGVDDRIDGRAPAAEQGVGPLDIPKSAVTLRRVYPGIVQQLHSAPSPQREDVHRSSFA